MLLECRDAVDGYFDETSPPATRTLALRLLEQQSTREEGQRLLHQAAAGTFEGEEAAVAPAEEASAAYTVTSVFGTRYDSLLADGEKLVFGNVEEFLVRFPSPAPLDMMVEQYAEEEEEGESSPLMCCLGAAKKEAANPGPPPGLKPPQRFDIFTPSEEARIPARGRDRAVVRQARGAGSGRCSDVQRASRHR